MQSTKGRKKLPRCTVFNPKSLVYNCRGPVKLSPEELDQRPKIHLTKEELQTLVDKDIDKKTMEEGCECMGISKTVYAGIYTSAREKLTQSLITGSILMIDCKE